MIVDRGWYIKAKPCGCHLGQWVAWCARTPNLGMSPLDPPPHVDVWFEFGDDEDDAIRKLMCSVMPEGQPTPAPTGGPLRGVA